VGQYRRSSSGIVTTLIAPNAQFAALPGYTASPTTFKTNASGQFASRLITRQTGTNTAGPTPLIYSDGVTTQVVVNNHTSNGFSLNDQGTLVYTDGVHAWKHDANGTAKILDSNGQPLVAQRMVRLNNRGDIVTDHVLRRTDGTTVNLLPASVMLEPNYYGTILNNAGTAAVMAYDWIRGGSSILVTDADNVPHDPFAAGTQIDVDPGPGVTLRTIASLANDIAQQPYHPFLQSDDVPNEVFALNDANELVAMVNFTDGTTGVVVVTVPEPVSVSLLALGGFALSRRRRR
jgi:hypothetical protein